MSPTPQTFSTGFVVAVVGFFSSFPIVLQGLSHVGSSDGQAASGLMFAAFAMGLAGVLLSLRTRAPVSVAWSTPGAALLAVTAPVEAGFAGAVAGFVTAGALALLAGLWKPLARFAASIPPAIAQAMLAGVLLPICLVPVVSVVENPAIIGPVIVTWFVLSRINRLLAVPGAVLAAALVIVFATDMSTYAPQVWVQPPVWTTPVFSWASVLGIGVPLFIVTMATQNIPGIAVMRGFGFAPSPGPLFASVGAFSVLSAPFGAPATCLAAITAAMCSGEESDPDPAKRHWSAVFAGGFYCIFGLFAALITGFAALAPASLLASVAGIALLPVLAGSSAVALKEEATREAAIITFVVTASGITILGLGAAVWGLVAGGVVHLVNSRKAKHG